MFGKFDGETVKRTFMHPCNKPFNHLRCEQIKVIDLTQTLSPRGEGDVVRAARDPY